METDINITHILIIGNQKRQPCHFNLNITVFTVSNLLQMPCKIWEEVDVRVHFVWKISFNISLKNNWTMIEKTSVWRQSYHLISNWTITFFLISKLQRCPDCGLMPSVHVQPSSTGDRRSFNQVKDSRLLWEDTVYTCNKIAKHSYYM